MPQGRDYWSFCPEVFLFSAHSLTHAHPYLQSHENMMISLPFLFFPCLSLTEIVFNLSDGKRMTHKNQDSSENVPVCVCSCHVCRSTSPSPSRVPSFWYCINNLFYSCNQLLKQDKTQRLPREAFQSVPPIINHDQL